MKKVITASAFAILGIVALSSCTKDYTCECRIAGSVSGTTTITDTKSNAKDSCDDGDITIFGISQDCEIL
ncbi:MAG: hypothetical protein QNK23_09850 [Crocinitomicaceae bacterium]|nr:hypothetical protein [Crocinitomicaceae bacterium]